MTRQHYAINNRALLLTELLEEYDPDYVAGMYIGRNLKMFPSISEASKETGISRLSLTKAMDEGKILSFKNKRYKARDLTSEEIIRLVERQREDARERAKLSGVGG